MDSENDNIKEDVLAEGDEILGDEIVEVEEIEEVIDPEVDEDSLGGAISANSEEEEIAAYMYQQEDWTM